MNSTAVFAVSLLLASATLLAQDIKVTSPILVPVK